jgi:hypothetical protein
MQVLIWHLLTNYFILRLHCWLFLPVNWVFNFTPNLVLLPVNYSISSLELEVSIFFNFDYEFLIYIDVVFKTLNGGI